MKRLGSGGSDPRFGRVFGFGNNWGVRLGYDGLVYNGSRHFPIVGRGCGWCDADGFNHGAGYGPFEPGRSISRGRRRGSGDLWPLVEECFEEAMEFVEGIQILLAINEIEWVRVASIFGPYRPERK